MGGERWDSVCTSRPKGKIRVGPQGEKSRARKTNAQRKEGNTEHNERLECSSDFRDHAQN